MFVREAKMPYEQTARPHGYKVRADLHGDTLDKGSSTCVVMNVYNTTPLPPIRIYFSLQLACCLLPVAHDWRDMTPQPPSRHSRVA